MSYDKQECMSALEESDEVFNAKMQKGYRGYMSKLYKKNKKAKKTMADVVNGQKVDFQQSANCTVVVLE